jgi:hypothetical protein
MCLRMETAGTNSRWTDEPGRSDLVDVGGPLAGSVEGRGRQERGSRNLAVLAARAGKDVLLVDGDSQETR